MKKIVLALAILTIPAAAFSMASTPESRDAEAKAEAVVSRAELSVVDMQANTILSARQPGKSTPAEIKATAGYQNAAQKAFYAAGDARMKLNRAEFDKQAKIVKDNYTKACAILSGC